MIFQDFDWISVDFPGFWLNFSWFSDWTRHTITFKFQGTWHWYLIDRCRRYIYTEQKLKRNKRKVTANNEYKTWHPSRANQRVWWIAHDRVTWSLDARLHAKKNKKKKNKIKTFRTKSQYMVISLIWKWILNMDSGLAWKGYI